MFFYSSCSSFKRLNFEECRPIPIAPGWVPFLVCRHSNFLSYQSKQHAWSFAISINTLELICCGLIKLEDKNLVIVEINHVLLMFVSVHRSVTAGRNIVQTDLYCKVWYFYPLNKTNAWKQVLQGNKRSKEACTCKTINYLIIWNIRIPSGW